MPDTYRNIDLPEDGETTTITRTCDGRGSGCGGDIEITVHPDGSYEGGLFLGNLELPTEDAEVVNEVTKDDPWYGTMTETIWSDYRVEEFWRHNETECIVPPDYDPEDVEHSVAD